MSVRLYDRDKRVSIYCTLQLKGFWWMTAREIDLAYRINAVIKHDACSSKNADSFWAAKHRPPEIAE